MLKALPWIGKNACILVMLLTPKTFPNIYASSAILRTQNRWTGRQRPEVIMYCRQHKLYKMYMTVKHTHINSQIALTETFFDSKESSSGYP